MNKINSEVEKLFYILGNENLRFVGGCVRDYLLNNGIKDIDLATTILPNTVKSILNSHNIKTIETGIAFGTVIAVFNQNSYEITA